MRLATVLLAMALATAWAGPAAAQVLAPGRWQVDWSEQYCSLIHRSASDPDLTMVVRLVPGSVYGDLLLVRSACNSDSVGRRPATIILEGVEGVEERDANGEAELRRVELPGTGRQALQSVTIGSALLRRMVRSSRVRVTNGGREVVTFGVTAGPRAAAAAADCERSRLTEWGLDPSAPTAEPVGSPARWFLSADYSRAAARERRQGEVVIAMVAKADGSLAGCRVLATSGHDDLDVAACDAMAPHARFRAFEGVDRYTTRRILWRLP